MTLPAGQEGLPCIQGSALGARGSSEQRARARAAPSRAERRACRWLELTFIMKMNQKYNYNITLRIHELETDHRPEFYNSDAKKIGRADVLYPEPGTGSEG